ncbi:MAG: hypothetical protein HFI26_04295 [Lachnospiraceae bacterium]|jgi:hypothetical protein|nr:hypothetical protein [Lachnospiraceae bacterium]
MTDKNYNEFLEITGTDRNLTEDINDLLLNGSCKREIKTAKSGFTVSYLFQDTKKTLATFVCRKTGIKIRIFPQRLNEYADFLDTLPAKMKKEITKASVCKRLINPNDCNPKCAMGYDFIMDKEHYQKCRYMAFLLSVTEESTPYIKKFLQNELM